MGTATSAGGLPTAGGASSQPLRSGAGGGAGSGLGGGLQGTGLAGGCGTANTYCPSSMCIEVGESKFHQIVTNVFKDLIQAYETTDQTIAHEAKLASE